MTTRDALITISEIRRCYTLARGAISRIENNRRYVTDIEIREIAKIFHVTYEELIDG